MKKGCVQWVEDRKQEVEAVVVVPDEVAVLLLQDLVVGVCAPNVGTASRIR